MNLPDVQLFQRPGIVEYGWGHPDLELLPAADLARAAEIALRRWGRHALSYGAEQGPGCLIEALQGWLACQEASAPPAPELFITGGVSQALDMMCTLFTRPGDVVLVESPVYHLALRIFRDHGLELAPVAADEDGLQIDVLEEVIESLRLRGRAPRFLYTVPTFNNPTGMTMPLERRCALVALARQAGLLVLEDDVYHALWFDAPPPPSLYSLGTAMDRGRAPAGPIVRLGSFSKVLAPGLRLGWLAALPDIVQACVRSGLLDSGGGVSHFAAHVVAEFIELGLLDAQVERLRGAYTRRRDCLIDALARYLPATCSWQVPGGGFFVWLRLPEGCDTDVLLPRAEAAGVSYVPGYRFYAATHAGPGSTAGEDVAQAAGLSLRRDTQSAGLRHRLRARADGGGECCARLAFSLLPLQELEEGVRRLAVVLDSTEPR